MRILLLTHAFNSLSQRLHVELRALGHEVSVELDINDATTEEAAALFAPDVIVAPLLRRRIPDSVFRRWLCLVVHPGIPGDRGPSSLDWAIQDGVEAWGVTVLQAEADLDAGPVWAHRHFPMRAARKSSLYRFEVTEAATAAVLEAVEALQRGARTPQRPQPPSGRGTGWRDAMRQSDRRIDWARDDTATVLRRIRAADGWPGVADTMLGLPVRLFDAHPEGELRGPPGEPIARRDEAVCVATTDGAVWVGHLRATGGDEPAFKLPATRVLGARAAHLPEMPLDPMAPARGPTWRDIGYTEDGDVGILRFDFYNGAMSTDRCRRLLAAYRAACERPTRALVLAGGSDFWSNGLHLHVIEAAASPADESWRNIRAMDDLTEAVIRTTDRVVIAAVGGNAGAGGVFLALAADRVLVRDGVILNPHYKNMGNLYGSEYWTYLLPRRTGDHGEPPEVMRQRLPLGAREALGAGLADMVGPGGREAFDRAVRAHAHELAADRDWAARVADKAERLRRDEAHQPLDAYRDRELERMRLNFYGFDPSYHVARHRFVHRTPHAWTPRHLALHRRLGGTAGRPVDGTEPAGQP